MRQFTILTVLFFQVFITNNIFAQDSRKAGHNVKVSIPNVALIDIESEGNSTITLSAKGPKEAGEFLDFSKAEDQSLWLNISSVIGNKGKRKVTVALTEGKIPEGIALKARAFKGNHDGTGHMGHAVGSKVTINRQQQTIINNVGTGYSGDGVRRGYNLWYGMDLKSKEDVSKINFDQSTTLTLTYTFTDQ